MIQLLGAARTVANISLVLVGYYQHLVATAVTVRTLGSVLLAADALRLVLSIRFRY